MLIKAAVIIASVMYVVPVKLHDYKLSWPVKASRVSSEYGFRTFDHQMHGGIDLVAPEGTVIASSGNGIVAFAGDSNSGGGLMVIVRHPDSVETIYEHLSVVLTHLGAKVKQGQTIGRVGSTGNSTGNHLHMEVRIYGFTKDPRDIIEGNPVRQ